MAGTRWICFDFRAPRTFDYATINLNPRKRAQCDHDARPSQTDRQTDGQTDEHHFNIGTIRSNERIAR